jgi:hypothetical protein
MARRYINPNRPAAGLVTDDLLDAARERVASTAARLRAAEGADPGAANWDEEYEISSGAARAAERRLAALESLRARQVERGGQRDATLKAAARDLETIASQLAASRDQAAAAAAAHLKALSAVASAVAAHNRLLAASRAQVASLGLQVRDDLLDEGSEHGEGATERGLRLAGQDWIPIPPGGVEAHALRQVFASYGPLHPLAGVGKGRWRAFEVEGRADGMRVPVLADVKATVPAAPVAAPVPDRPSIRDLMAPASLPMAHPDWKPRAQKVAG